MSLAGFAIRKAPRAHRAWNALWPLVTRYWFDLVIVVGIGLSIATAVFDQGKQDGP